VGPYEADISKQMISTSSPIARALIGKVEGDSVEVQTPRGPHPYEIVTISLISETDL
jgi:transcription elongation factor GreA